MIKSNKSLWKSLFVFIISTLVCFIALFLVLILVFNLNGSSTKQIRNFAYSRLNNFSAEVESDFGKVTNLTIAFSSRLSDSIEAFCEEENINPRDLQGHTELIEPLITSLYELTAAVPENDKCSGAFFVLNATVNPSLVNAENSKAGLYLRRSGINTPDDLTSKLYCLIGPAKTAREYKTKLMGQWQMEFTIRPDMCYSTVIDTAKENTALPLESLYYWTQGLVTLESGEAGMIVVVPIITKEGDIIGICGGEVSDSLFSQLYTTSSTSYPRAFYSLLPVENDVYSFDQGLLAGDIIEEEYYTYRLKAEPGRAGFTRFKDEAHSFEGMTRQLNLYTKSSPYVEEKWETAILLPEKSLNKAIVTDSNTLMIMVTLLLVMAVVVSVFISKRYLQPVLSALNSIKANEPAETPYVEINDLMEFLAAREKEMAKEMELAKEKEQAEAKPAAVEQTSPQVPMFDTFVENIKTLSKAEKNVFNLYIEGYNAQEIAEKLHLSINTIKTHNRRIFAKLNVSTRKELMVYLDLLKQTDYFKEEE